MIEIDLSRADIEIFDRYEERSLRILEEHGGVVLARVRDVDELREWHLVRLPSHAAWEAFRADPGRSALAWMLERSKVAVQRHEVWRVE
jgi:uncharacterized protein (DUF1330 family)